MASDFQSSGDGIECGSGNGEGVAIAVVKYMNKIKMNLFPIFIQLSSTSTIE